MAAPQQGHSFIFGINSLFCKLWVYKYYAEELYNIPPSLTSNDFRNCLRSNTKYLANRRLREFTTAVHLAYFPYAILIQFSGGPITGVLNECHKPTIARLVIAVIVYPVYL
jgi:hypothetical protein